MTGKKWRQLAIGLSLAALFLYLTLRQIGIGDVADTIALADLQYLALALLAIVAGYSCRIERWRLMLVSTNPELRWRDCAGPLLASFAANNVLPFRAGDVMRSLAFNSRLGTTAGVVLATVFVERLLDLLVILGLLGVALAWFGVDAAGFAGVGGVVLLAIAAAVLTVLLFPRLFTPLAFALVRGMARCLPRLGSRIVDEVEKCMLTLNQLAGGDRMAVFILWSLVAWLLEGGAYWAAAWSLASLKEPLGAWLAMPVGALATLLPSTPGYVGTFDYFTARAMMILGNETSGATVYALLVHAVIWLPVTLGGACYWLLRSSGLRNRNIMAS